MGNDLSIIEFIESCYPEGLPGEIVFYGGSFNPWHDGHREAIKRVNDKHVIVIPDRNPLKPINPFSLKESEERIEADLASQQWLYTGFLNKKTHNPTQIWVNEIRQKYPLLEISFLMGFDNFAILDKWYRGDLLISDLNRLYVLSRNDNEEVKKLQTNKIKNQNNNLELIFLGAHAFEDISSTKLRENQIATEDLKDLVAAI
jgi:nicotinate-nucleotide adenylyltransferase